MLSKILSYCFRVAFVLIALVWIISITSQVLKRPVSSFTAKNPVHPFGRPGVQLASRQVTYPADDTSEVKVSIEIANEGDTGIQTSSRTFKLKDMATVKDEISQELQAGLFGRKKPAYPVVIETESIDRFQVMPQNGWHQAVFIIHDTLLYGSVAWIFLCLSVLFRNFSKKDYFTLPNISLIRKTGWLLLVPQLLTLTVYCIYLLAANAKTIANSNTRRLALLDVYADINWAYVAVALGCLVLSYTFKKAFTMKEDHDLFT